MDWKTFVVQLTQALVWPLVLVSALIAYRDKLTAIFERLASIKIGGFEAAFGTGLSQTRERLPPTPAKDLRELAADDELEELAERSPRGAILEAWLRVETKLDEIASKQGIERKLPILKLLATLMDRSLIDRNIGESIRGLTTLRNLAVHASDVELTTQKAVDFIVLARAVLFVLSRA